MADEREAEEVGDSSTNLLANYQRCARELLKSALLEQHGGKLFAAEKAPKLTELKRCALIRAELIASKLFYIEILLFIGERRNCRVSRLRQLWN